MSLRRSPPVRIAAVVSDVDGTLVTGDKVLTDRTRAAVAKIRQAGLPFCLISSRPPRGLAPVLRSLGLDTPAACFNGGMLVAPDLTPLEEHLLPGDSARRTVEFLDRRGVDVWLFGGGDWMVRDEAGAYVDHERRTIGFAPLAVADFAPSVARSQPYYLDTTVAPANKGAGLRALARRLGVAPTEIAVFGDGANDVAMFEQSGLAIAMGNAAPVVRERADCVTAASAEDGFALAVERFIL